MFARNQKKTKLDEAIDDALDELKGFDAAEDGYQKMITNIDTLIKLKVIEKPDRMSKDTLAVVAGNLLGIVAIVAYEQRHVMQSKALGFILRSR